LYGYADHDPGCTFNRWRIDVVDQRATRLARTGDMVLVDTWVTLYICRNRRELHMTETLKERAIRLEGVRTAKWATRELLRRELLTREIWDPCCGLMDMVDVIREAGYHTHASDIYRWDRRTLTICYDFLSPDVLPPWRLTPDNLTIMMNPPFSKSVEFVERAFEIGARKIVCFQRFAWWESEERQEFWQRYRPNRIYICGSRAHCWRFDIDPALRVGTFGALKPVIISYFGHLVGLFR